MNYVPQLREGGGVLSVTPRHEGQGIEVWWRGGRGSENSQNCGTQFVYGPAGVQFVLACLVCSYKFQQAVPVDWIQRTE